MQIDRPASEYLKTTLVNALLEITRLTEVEIGESENIFSKFNLDSMATIGLISKLEKELNVVIGEDISDFDRMKTFSGFQRMLLEKAEAVVGSDANIQKQKGD